MACLLFDIDAVRLNRLTASASNTDVETVVKEWLRTASDRNGGRRKRESTAGTKRPFPVDDNISSDDDGGTGLP